MIDATKYPIKSRSIQIYLSHSDQTLIAQQCGSSVITEEYQLILSNNNNIIIIIIIIIIAIVSIISLFCFVFFSLLFADGI